MENIFVQLLLLFLSISLCQSFPLSSKSRWIVDDANGARVKLGCVNWAGHLEPLIPEGLQKQPVDKIVDDIISIGFNCVRLTYATHMYTRYAGVQVEKVLRDNGLQDALTGIARNNPRFLHLNVLNAQKSVVNALVRKGVMVILDNHLSKPMWCCDNNDGNGFFWDQYFDPKEWQKGLYIAATIYKDVPQVIGMSLRNELRGPKQNEKDWYQYVAEGATTIHNANPKLLVLISGLNYDLTLGFLQKNPLYLNFKNKIVYEIHRYSYSAGGDFWLNQPFKQACDKFTQQFYSDAGFLTEGPNAAPLFLSEFGVNQANLGQGESAFLDCLTGYLATSNLDWSVWALQGSYYIRNGIQSFDETYGMLNNNWSSVRNQNIAQKLRRLIKK